MKLITDGFGPNLKIIDSLQIGATLLKCFPNMTDSVSDVDSSLIVADLKSRKAVLNFNDNINSPSYSSILNKFLTEHSFELSLFCLGYTGAGSYPQTYYSPTDTEKLMELANRKKHQFFERYKRTIEMIPSLFRLPFAGKYLLAGELSFLNQYRGVADALEVQEIDSSAIVLDDSGMSFFDLITLKPSSQRTEYYPTNIRSSTKPYDWQTLFLLSPMTPFFVDCLFKPPLKRITNQNAKKLYF